MPNISIQDAKAWTEDSKVGANFTTIDEDLEKQIASQILPRVAISYDVAAWTSPETTPLLVRSIIAMYYVAALYDKVYSTDSEAAWYSGRLRRLADDNLELIVAGTVELPEVPGDDLNTGAPVFFPNDLSSSNEPTSDAPSDGPPSFLMGTVW